MAGSIYQAIRSFSANGRVIRAGETVREGHRLLKDYPEKFQPIDVRWEVAEQATASPGKKRTTTAKK